VILIAASELSSPATAGMLRAARETLGASTSLRLEARNAAVEAPQATSVDPNRAYVSISWQGPNHERALIVGHLPRSSTDAERVLTFGSADPEEERGRSVGFVVASLFAAFDDPTYAQPRAPLVVTPPRAPTKLLVPPENRYAFSLAAVMASPGDANSFGAYFDATREFGVSTGFGLYADARIGAIPTAQASTRWLSLGVVGSVRLISLSSRARVAAVARVGGRQFAITHLSEDDVTPDKKITYLPLGSLALRFSLDLTQYAAIYTDVGAEAQGGKIQVNVRGRTAATIPILLGTVGVGVMARF